MPQSDLNIVTLIQARTGSSRLPNKVLLDVIGKPLLVRMVERVQMAAKVGQVVVITSNLPEDDVIESFCYIYDITCFRGHPFDLLDRHYHAAVYYHADVVLKIPSDCPLIDPAVIDKVIDRYLEKPFNYDYVSNLHPATYPDGNDVEVFSMGALVTAWAKAFRDYEREHTTPYFWEHPDEFKIGNVRWETGLDYSLDYRFTIDYPEDYDFIYSIYKGLYYHKPSFSVSDILNYIKANPHLHSINKKHLGKYWYDNHIRELRNIDDFKLKKGIR